MDSDLEDSDNGVDPSVRDAALRMDSANFSIDRASVTSVVAHRTENGAWARFLTLEAQAFMRSQAC